MSLKQVLHLSTRLKELIKYKNCHLHPRDVEEVIQKHPGVKEVAVFGRTDPVVQELVTAAVVKAREDLTANDIIDFVNKEVDDHKKLRGGVIFTSELPKDESGSVIRRKLSEML